MPKHWQPKMDKAALLADLNDYIAPYGAPIGENTKMTANEIQIITHALDEMEDKLREMSANLLTITH